MKTKTSWRPVISLETKNKIVDDLSNGINQKIIADKYQVSQSFITDTKDVLMIMRQNRDKAT